VLHVNDTAVERARIDDFVQRDGFGSEARIVQYSETLPGGRSHRIIELGDALPLDNTLIYRVPPGYVFAMGDNRDNSQDSRVLTAVGYIPIENLVGRAEFLFFSHDGTAAWWELWRWPFAIRYGRLFQGIQ
jgi:signal peptidase I